MSKDVLGASALAEVAGPLKTFFERLGGPQGLTWLEDFKRFLRKENPWVFPSLWRTFTIGGVSKDQLLRQFTAAGIKVSQSAHDLMARYKFVTSPQPHDVAFGRATVRQFGFTELPTTLELLARVRDIGTLCEPEDALYIRRTLDDQPNGDVCWAAMEPIADSAGDPYVFNVKRHDGGQRWLNTNDAPPYVRWGLEDVFVFRLR